MENAYRASAPMELGLKLSKHDISEVFDVTIYKSLVGSLMYLTTTRSDFMFSVGLLSKIRHHQREVIRKMEREFLHIFLDRC